MKKNFILMVLMLIVFFHFTLAQGVFSNQTNKTLEQVIQDYPNQFKNIKGDVLGSTQNTIEYKSNIYIPGAISTSITHYALGQKKIISWQTTVYSTTDFDEASNKFEALYTQIKNTIIKLDGENPVILNGYYEEPVKQKKYSSILFDLLPLKGNTQNLKIDLTLKKENTVWKIILCVYDKDKKDWEALVFNNK